MKTEITEFLKKMSKGALTKDINFLKSHLLDLEDCYYNKYWETYLGKPIYPQIRATKAELEETIKERESREPQYYFKFCVPDSQAHYFNTYKAAARKAKATGEKVYLEIYSVNNRYNEVYADTNIGNQATETDIKNGKDYLINHFNKLTNATPEQI